MARPADVPRHHPRVPVHVHAVARHDRRRSLLRDPVPAAPGLRGGVRPIPLRGRLRAHAADVPAVRGADRRDVPLLPRAGIHRRCLSDQGSRSRLDGVLWGHAVPLLVAVLFLLPLVWMVTASLRQPGLPPPRTIEWLPDPIRLDNYASVFGLLPFGRYLLNSLAVVALAVPLTIVTASMAGFAMAQLERRTRHAARRPLGGAPARARHRALVDALPALPLGRARGYPARARGAGADGLEPALRAAVLLDVPAHPGRAVRARRAWRAPVP